jgi:predicted PurR-regulated permease PerM
MESINLRERLFFYIVFIILIILMSLMLKPFFTVLVVSLISVIMLKPLYNFFMGLTWVKERKGLAASLTLLAVLVILIIPVFLIARLTVTQLASMFEQLAALDLDAVIQSIQQSLAELPLVGGIQPFETSATETVRPLARPIAQALADFAVSLGASIPSLIVQGVIFIVVVATLLPVYDTLIPQLEDISPLGPELSELYTRKITAMVKSLVLGVFLIAIIQGAAMGFFFWLAGLPYVFLFTLLSMLLALIPMVGISWLVIAIAIVSFLTGNWVQALIVLFGFYGVVNWIDILLRPKLLAEEASINFALFILAILGGLAWAGIMGLFYGPVLMLLLVTTIEIYAERYAHEDRSLVGEALSRLGNDSEAVEPGAEAGQDAATTTTPAEGTGGVDSESKEQAVDL